MLVSIDACILIDMKFASLLLDFFQLPWTFCISDLIFHNEILDDEIRNYESHLSIIPFDSNQISDLYSLYNSQNALSINDISAFILARDNDCLLLTSEKALRKFAEKRSIHVHGTLWILDEMVSRGLLTPRSAKHALDLLIINNSRLSTTLINSYIHKWFSTPEHS